MAVGENNLPVQIQILRKTLQQDTNGESYLFTVSGRDYRLVGHSRRSQAADIVAKRLRPGQMSGRVTKFTQSPPKRDIILLIKG
jgi:DNA-binding winged helix-turn-helix (wHTH) protein